MQDTRSFVNWLRKQMRRLTAIYEALDHEPMLVEEVHLAAGKVAEEAGERAMRLGLPDLHAASLPLIGLADPLEVKTFLAECVAACESTKDGDGLMTVAEVASHLRVSPRTVYRLCAEDKLAHQHLGSGRGTIRIQAENLVAFERKAAKQGKPKDKVTLEQLRSV